MMKNQPKLTSIIILFLFSSFINGCQQSPVIDEPENNIEKFVVSFSPSFSQMRPDYESCASQYQTAQVAIFVIESFDFDQKSDIHIQAGEQDIVGKFVAQVGTEEIRFITNIINNENLTLEKIKELYLGDIENWEDGSKINKWIYPDFNDFQPIFYANIVQLKSIDKNTGIAPSTELMLEIVRDDPFAIGFVPMSWDSDLVNATTITLDIPVLAVAKLKPAEPLMNFISCLQSFVNQSQP